MFKSLKRILTNKNTYLYGLILFFLVAIIFEIHEAYAFYYDEYSTSIIGNIIGNFDENNFDASIMIYKENDNGQFVRVYSVPDLSYYKMNSSVSCTPVSCTNDANVQNADCYYSFNNSTNEIQLTTKNKVSCRFYFEKIASSDISVIILTEDENGTYSREVNSQTKNYKISSVIPSVGYEYSNYYNCINGSSADTSLVYNDSLRKFTVETSVKNTCYVYFDSTGSADIIANIYVQAAADSQVYNKVSTIPSEKNYVINGSKSACYDENGNTVTSSIIYSNGFINVDTTEKQECDIYLDLYED